MSSCFSSSWHACLCGWGPHCWALSHTHLFPVIYITALVTPLHSLDHPDAIIYERCPCCLHFNLDPLIFLRVGHLATCLLLLSDTLLLKVICSLGTHTHTHAIYSDHSFLFPNSSQILPPFNALYLLSIYDPACNQNEEAALSHTAISSTLRTGDIFHSVSCRAPQVFPCCHGKGFMKQIPPGKELLSASGAPAQKLVPKWTLPRALLGAHYSLILIWTKLSWDFDVYDTPLSSSLSNASFQDLGEKTQHSLLETQSSKGEHL